MRQAFNSTTGRFAGTRGRGRPEYKVPEKQNDGLPRGRLFWDSRQLPCNASSSPSFPRQKKGAHSEQCESRGFWNRGGPPVIITVNPGRTIEIFSSSTDCQL